jgi:hypothetical protein
VELLVVLPVTPLVRHAVERVAVGLAVKPLVRHAVERVVVRLPVTMMQGGGRRLEHPFLSVKSSKKYDIEPLRKEWRTEPLRARVGWLFVRYNVKTNNIHMLIIGLVT